MVINNYEFLFFNLFKSTIHVKIENSYTKTGAHVNTKSI